MAGEDLREVVRQKYGEAALRVTTGGSSCCGATAANGSSCDPITSNLYDASQIGQIPEEALLASLGCGNPTALAQLKPARSCSISAPAAASMFCFRPGVWAPPAKLMGWT